MTDVLLFQTDDDGDILLEGGLIRTEQGLETAAYLTLFGANEEDSGSPSDDSIQFWGNLLEDDPLRKLRGRFQNLCRTLPVTSANLQLLQEAAEADMLWFVEAEIASTVSLEVSIPAVSRVRVDVDLTVSTRVYNFSFDGTWERQV